MLQEKIQNIVDEIVEKNGFLLVDFVLRGNKTNRIIEVFIDNKKGVSTDECAEISRLITDKLDEEDIIDSKYRLDVSSPGLDKPLKYLVQFERHIERKMSITYNTDDVSQSFEGKLLRIEGERLVFQKGKDEITLDFNQIKKAKVLISF